MAAAKTELTIWEQMESVNLPRAPRGEQQYLYVSVNDRVFQVPRGKTSKVPKPIADRIRIMMEFEAAADAYAKEVEESKPFPTN